MNKENIRERDGRGKINIKIKIKGELTSYKEIVEKAKELGFPYL